MEWDNQDRNRYYGLRVGDIVEQQAFGTRTRGKVVKYALGDNNRVYLEVEGESKLVPVVAEWCVIIKKVDDGEPTT